MSNRLIGLKALLKPVASETYAHLIENSPHTTAEVPDATAEDISRADEQRLGKEPIPSNQPKLRKL